ncbi:MAG: imidazole glycerol phosphate synthase subunit HisH [Myxococcota bacterium]|nr:imidazole glycerol phosphate synthase subunit HisH [Myxococcota bacterium]
MTPASPRVALLDYGSGNLRSVAKALERSRLRVAVVGDGAALPGADAVVLPGVGAFADAMASLRAKGLADAVRRWIDDGRPYVGLCLGLQVLFDESDEHGRTPGLGVLPGRIVRFPDADAAGRPLRVPHIGWNRVRFRGDHPVRRELPEEDVFYFVHSYRAEPDDPACVAGTTDYGGPFAAAVARDNVFAVQFHPEKSQSSGRRLLDALAGWIASCV